MPKICLISSSDRKNILYQEELTRELRREGITIESSLTNCQVMVILQTIETTQSYPIKTLLASTQRLIRQQQLQENARSLYEDFLQTIETHRLSYSKAPLASIQSPIRQQQLQKIVRFIYEDIDPLPEGWDMFPTINATENRVIAAKQLAQFILHASKSTSPFVQPADSSGHHTNPPKPALLSTGSDDSLKEASLLAVQRDVPATARVKSKETHEDATSTLGLSLKGGQPEQGALAKPIKKQDVIQEPILTEGKAVSKEFALPLKENEESTFLKRPSHEKRKADERPIGPSLSQTEKTTPSPSATRPLSLDQLLPDELKTTRQSTVSAPIEQKPGHFLPVTQSPQPSQFTSALKRFNFFVRPAWLRRWWLLAVAAVILLIAFPGMFSLLMQKPRPATLPAAQAVGYAYFFSSGIVNASNTAGMNDGLQIELTHIPPPARGMQYYGWLLPDLKQHGAGPIPLGTIPVRGGAVHVRFINPAYTDLLAQTSQFLITQESASLPPLNPSSQHFAWRYYAQLPQQPGTTNMGATMGNMMHLSYLDHLRHLLVEDPDITSIAAHGGVSLWTMENIRKVLEWANAARGTGIPQDPAIMHRQFIRILDYLDGELYVKQDLSSQSPFLADQVGGHFGLLTINANESPPGYLQVISMHLEDMVHSPGATSSERLLARQIDIALAQVKANLEQVRQDAIQLVNTPEDQLQSTKSTNILDDLVVQANNAYIGVYDPQTGNHAQGITWICDQIQHLATFEVKVYTSGQIPDQAMPQQATPMSKM